MSTELATMNKPSLLVKMSSAVGLDPDKFYAAVKTSCGCQGATNEHFSVLLMTADRYGLNPMMRQLYLMQTKKGIEVVIPVDGWVPLLTRHADYLAHEVAIQWAGEAFKTKCVAATARIWTRSRNALGLGPFEHTELMTECEKDTGPWRSHPVRMIGHKAVIQGTRRCFGIYVQDSDEAQGIEGKLEMLRPKTLTVSLSEETPAGDDTIDAEVHPTDLPRQNEPYTALVQRIRQCDSSDEAQAITEQIELDAMGGAITAEEVAEPKAALQRAMN